jgi:FlaA1/EpsC-like NDP-sugar epimerase
MEQGMGRSSLVAAKRAGAAGLATAGQRWTAVAWRRLPFLVSDALIVVVSFVTAMLFRFLGQPERDLAHYLAPLFVFQLPLILLYLGVNAALRLDRRLWRYTSVGDVLFISVAAGVSTLVALIGDVLWGSPRPLPLSVVTLGGFFSLCGFVAVRYRERLVSGVVWRWHALRGRLPDQRVRTLIFGAGDSGQSLALRLLLDVETRHYELVGFVDDDPAKRGSILHGLKVLGDRRHLAEVVERERVDLVVLAVRHIAGEELEQLIAACQATSARIKVAPNLVDWIASPNSTPLLREVNVQDLLGRRPVDVDRAACRASLADKTVFVTGGCGSIGSELCWQILTFDPRCLVVLDTNESGLYDLEVELRIRFPQCDIHVIVGDVSDEQKLDALFARFRPHVVFHAAAYKHVPLMEQFPEEALRVNVRGTWIVSEAARRYRAERFVLVSTDKAIRPTSVMGATKRIAELLVLGAGGVGGAEAGDGRPTICAAVRFGNVLGSRGSVIPTFAKQIELGGPVTVTHPEMTRYFIEISEAVSLIIQAATLTRGGDVFMLEMGCPVNIAELAHKMLRMRGLRPGIDIAISYIGMRPGEKLHEELIGIDEAREPTAHPQIYRISGANQVQQADVHQLLRRLAWLAEEGGREQLAATLVAMASHQALPSAAERQVPGHDWMSISLGNNGVALAGLDAIPPAWGNGLGDGAVYAAEASRRDGEALTA